jgi:phosphatidylserine decarboxylase
MEEYLHPDPPSQTAFPIARAGYPYIVALSFATAIFALLGIKIIALLGMVATLCVCGFFRDPDRVVPNMAAAVVSPADGKIIMIDRLETSPFYAGQCIKISIFMTVFNVHVNRIPHEGRIKQVTYYPGKFYAANLDKASLSNEHNAVVIETEQGIPITVVQVAGLIARRIICRVQPGDSVQRGRRFGLICFGSRLDVYVPAAFLPDVQMGQKVKAGTTVLGRLS